MPALASPWQVAAKPGSAATFLFRTCTFTARPDSVARCEQLTAAFIEQVNAREPGVRFAAAFRDADQPRRFLVAFVFDDESAALEHVRSIPSRRFHLELGLIAEEAASTQAWEPGPGV